MSSVPARPQPGQVPTLTEVVEFEATEPAELDPVLPSSAPHDSPSGAPAAAAGDAERVDVALPETPAETELFVERVLADVQRSLDLSLEVRMRETLTPLLVRLTDAFVRDVRNQLNETLRSEVTRAVSQEIARQRRRRGA